MFRIPPLLCRQLQAYVTRLLLLIPVLFLGGLFSAILGPAAAPAVAQDSPLVLAFYYAWFDLNTWESGRAADAPLSAYASSDPATIERHIAEAQSAGIDAFIVSWYGPTVENNQTETNLRLLLDTAAAKGFRTGVDFECMGPFFPDQNAVTGALQTLLQTHAQHPAYLRYQGKPVIFFWREQRFSVDQWAAIRNQVDPDHNSIWIAEGVDIAYQAVFDGHHLYSIAWSPDPANTLNDWHGRVQRFEADNQVQRLWVATVMPGYDDTRTDRSDAFAVNRQNGEYYRQSWAAAIASQPDWVVITSFNEWVEGSMIEPSQSYGNLYLDITREQADRFRNNTQPAPEAEEPEEPVAQPSQEIEPPPSPTIVEESPPTPERPLVRADETVRIRLGPGTEYERIGRLAQNRTAPLTGRNQAGTWLQIETGDLTPGYDLGWVVAEFTTVSGNVGDVPLVDEENPGSEPTIPVESSPADLASDTVALITPTTAELTSTPRPTPTAVATLRLTQTPAPSSEPTATDALSPTPTPTQIMPTSAPSLTPSPTIMPLSALLQKPEPKLEEQKTAPPVRSWTGAAAVVGGLIALAGLVYQEARRRNRGN